MGGNDHPVIGMNQEACERLKIKDNKLDMCPEPLIFSRSLANLKRLRALPVSGLSVICLPDPCGILALFVF
jgi:hypothetical protein